VAKAAGIVHVEQDQPIPRRARNGSGDTAASRLRESREHLVRQQQIITLRFGVAAGIKRDHLSKRLKKSRVVQPRERELLAVEDQAAQRLDRLLEVNRPLDIAACLPRSVVAVIAPLCGSMR